ncbi:MAG: SUMF1/EgtB/PvdO family nonheme iron enzyme [Verrucomicrobiales bacterium]|nr:SUMF1/EgtB/PvdO family nonheme iron enzyme [Verrucomicrobiales bacterium]
MKQLIRLHLCCLLLCFLSAVSLTAQNNFNGSLHFGEVNSRLVLKSTSIPPPWTAEMWVRRHDASGPSAPLFIGDAGALKLEQFASERRVGFTKFGVGDYTFDYVAPADQWVHLSFVAGLDGSTALFVNGAFIDSQRVTIPLPLDYFGSSPAILGDQLAAEIDELRVWNIARSDEELAANFRTPLTGTEAGLVGYWRCDSLTDGSTPNAAAITWIGSGIVAGVTLRSESPRLDPAIILSRREVSVPERGSAGVGVRLSAAPLSNVVVAVQRLNGDPDLIVNAKNLLTFTPDNWQDDQPLPILALGDADAEDGTATFLIASTGAARLTSATFLARELDTDLAAPVRLAMRPVSALRLEGPSPAVYTVEFSHDPAVSNSWTFLTNVVVSNGASWLVDWEGLDDSRRFYRASVQPFQPITNMVYVAPGEFTMGSPNNEKERSEAELAHRVFITRGFWMGRFEVTQDEYYRIAGTRPSYFSGGNLPVEQVSWIDATNYCARLTAEERLAGRLPRGWVYRLPTAAEWEYACRAGSSTPFSMGSDLRSGMCNFDGHEEYHSGIGTVHNPTGIRLDQTIAVGSYAPNAWGLYDMHGNVMEWCLDGDQPYPAHALTDPLQPWGGHFRDRIARGGSFLNAGQFQRSAFWATRFEHGGPNDLGFRVVLAPADLTTP